MALRGWITLDYSMGIKPSYEYPCKWGKRQKALKEKRQCDHISKGWNDGTISKEHPQTTEAAKGWIFPWSLQREYNSANTLRTSAQWHWFLTSGSQNIGRIHFCFLRPQSGLQKPRTESSHVHLSKPAIIMLSIPAHLTQDKPQIR